MPASIQTLGEGLLANCKALQTVELNEMLIAEGEFNGCESLQTIVFNVVPEIIAKNAFANCKGLTSLALPEGISTIENGAFHGCKGLTEISLPASTSTIGQSAFSGCPLLKNIRCAAEQVPVTAASAFSGIAKEGLHIEVPANAVNAYMAAQGWKQLQPKEGQVFYPIQ